MGRLTSTPFLVLFVLLAAVGVGTAYAVALVTIDNLKVTGDTELDGKLIDTNNEAGTSGQVLSSIETGIDWIDVAGGPQGATGMTGMTGLMNTYFKVTPGSAGAGASSGFVSATCDSGDKVTGGGFFTSSPSDVQMIRSQPSGSVGTTPTAWVVEGLNEGTTTASVNAYVICADITP